VEAIDPPVADIPPPAAWMRKVLTSLMTNTLTMMVGLSRRRSGDDSQFARRGRSM
jgi:hypothetical protein